MRSLRSFSDTYKVLSHVVLKLMRVEFLHAIVKESKHGSTRLEAESLDETLARLETS